MAVNAARFAHCHARRPVAYRTRSSFRPAIAAPLDFAVRVGRVYTLDRELDRAVLQPSDYEHLVSEDLDRFPGPGGVFLASRGDGSPDATRARPDAQVRSARERFVRNEVRLSMEAARFRPPWTVSLLQDIHASLLDGLDLPGVAGELRTEPLVTSDPDGFAVSETCPPEKVAAELEEVLGWVDRVGATYHPLIPATVLFQSVYAIRPFPLGNVTVGRTLAVQYLRLFGLPNIGLTSLPRVSEGSRELMGRLLLWTEATGSFQELLDHSLDTVLEAYTESNDRWLGGSGRPDGLEEASLRLLTRARRDPGWFSTRDAMRWVGARSDQTVLRHLNDLVGRGLLESLGKTRGKRFRLASPVAPVRSDSAPPGSPELEAPGPSRRRPPRERPVPRRRPARSPEA
jgi:Fic family protein